MRRANVFSVAVASAAFGWNCPSESHACELHLGGATTSAAAPALPGVAPLPSFSSGNFSLNVPIYHSLPSAAAKVYLDFDGDFTANWGDYHPGQTPAYSTDGDVNSFSTQELANIHQIWMRVTEKFSPWKIDVTTEDPGNRNHRETLQVVIGGDGRNGGASYWPGVCAGGVSYPGSFAGGYPSTVFVFPGNLLNGDPKSVGEASAHESGHAFGLQHQSLYDAQGVLLNEYNPGDAQRAPIMGRSYDSARGLWWYGPSMTPTMFQDDYQVIGSAPNGFGWRIDTQGNAPANATPLIVSGDQVHGSGVIGVLVPQFNIVEEDYFSFHTDPGEILLNVDVAPFGPMLDASIFLYSATGQLLASSATSSLGESLNLTLDAGTYYLMVTTAGNYGDVGQYIVSGTIVGVPEPTTTLLASGALFLLGLRTRVRALRDLAHTRAYDLMTNYRRAARLTPIVEPVYILRTLTRLCRGELMAVDVEQKPSQQPKKATAPAATQAVSDGKVERDRLRMMMLIRRFEERTYQEYTKPGQRIGGFCHLYSGQESIAVGIRALFQKGKDYLINGYRDHGHALALGMDPNIAMAEMFGRATGCSKGKGGSMHFFDAAAGNMGGHGIVGGQLPLGTGMAFSAWYKKTGGVCFTLFGDGAINQGAFNEALNLASLLKLPCLFICENNGMAMGTHVHRSSAEPDLVKRGHGFNMPVKSIDGNDIDVVVHEFGQSVDRARKGEGPSYIVANTFRFRGHSMSDAMKYRTKEDAEKARLRDPIAMYQQRLRDKKLIDDAGIEKIEEEVRKISDDAVKFADESPHPDLAELYSDVLAEKYPLEK